MTIQVIDIKTNAVVKTFTDSRRAHRYADKRDMEYGAVRFVVRFA